MLKIINSLISNTLKGISRSAQRTFINYRDDGYLEAENLEEIREVFTKDCPPQLACIHFSSKKVNPYTEELHVKYLETIRKFPQYKHILVNCDLHERIKLYYAMKHNPGFLLLIQGAEISRVHGHAFDRLEEELAEVEHLHFSKFDYYGESRNHKEEFLDIITIENMVYRDKDPLKMYTERED